jgi:hypothetical protein
MRGRFEWMLRRPPQPSPTIGQCIHGGLGWLEVECNRCRTPGKPATRCNPPAAGYFNLETRGRTEMSVLREGPLRAARARDQADGDERDHNVSVDARRKAVNLPVR